MCQGAAVARAFSARCTASRTQAPTQPKGVVPPDSATTAGQNSQTVQVRLAAWHLLVERVKRCGSA
eukprot:357069-Chlamydomonas_euryale.AAC.1